MHEVGAVYPKIHQQWADKTGDEALAHFCRSGLAAHRVELAPEDCPYLDADGKPAKFVVRTNEMATLDVKEGCDRYGGDAYFGADWRPVAIVRKERPRRAKGRPKGPQGGQGERPREAKGTKDGHAGTFCFA